MDEQTLKELNSVHCRSQAKCQLVQTNCMKQIKLFLCLPYNKHLINRAKSVWENLDLDRVYRPHSVRSVLTTSVKILPYRPPARLIRAKYPTRANGIIVLVNSQTGFCRRFLFPQFYKAKSFKLGAIFSI